MIKLLLACLVLCSRVHGAVYNYACQNEMGLIEYRDYPCTDLETSLAIPEQILVKRTEKSILQESKKIHSNLQQASRNEQKIEAKARRELIKAKLKIQKQENLKNNKCQKLQSKIDTINRELSVPNSGPKYQKKLKTLNKLRQQKSKIACL